MEKRTYAHFLPLFRVMGLNTFMPISCFFCYNFGFC